ncbi:hypothetical protein N9L68_01170 [bacterium]|nr:hypothetical protein [bacterium]
MDPDNTWPRSQRPRAQQCWVLLKIMQQIFPEHIALKRDDKWYAAGHRVRGDGLPKESGGEEQQDIFLVHPRPGFWAQPQYAGMTHLKPLFCVAPPSPLEVGSGMPDVVVVSDFAMDLPGVMYGLACLLRENALNLLWLVSKPGAGAKELEEVWNKAPPLRFRVDVLQPQRRDQAQSLGRY